VEGIRQRNGEKAQMWAKENGRCDTIVQQDGLDSAYVTLKSITSIKTPVSQIPKTFVCGRPSLRNTRPVKKRKSSLPVKIHGG